MDAVKEKRRRLEPDQSRTLILAATERVMRAEGYAAVSTRRVAAEAGVKAPLVHYYYPTTDDLLMAFYRHSAAQTRARIAAAMESERPLRALWALNADAERTGLAAEFLALANHRKAIRAEIARNVEDFRAMQAPLFARVLDRLAIDPAICPPDAAAMLLAAVARALVMEGVVGVDAGHAGTIGFVEWMIGRLEGDDGQMGPVFGP